MRPTERQRQQSGSGVLSTVLELVLALGGYYLLRAVGVDVFWALTIPGIAVALSTVVTTVRRRRIDMIGLLVLVEVIASVALVLVTQDARIAAVREPIYIAISGAFCLLTLCFTMPLAHTSSAALASFGDPLRVEAFATAWREVPRYRLVQRVLTATLGLIMIVASGIRIAIICSRPVAELAHAIDVSTVVGIVMWVAIGVTSAVLIQPARRTIAGLLPATTG